MLVPDCTAVNTAPTVTQSALLQVLPSDSSFTRGVPSHRVSYGRIEYKMPLQCNFLVLASVCAELGEVVVRFSLTFVLETKSTTSFSLLGASKMHSEVLLLGDVLLGLKVLVELVGIGLVRGLSAGVKGSVSAEEHTEERGVPRIRVRCGRGELRCG